MVQWFSIDLYNLFFTNLLNYILTKAVLTVSINSKINSLSNDINKYICLIFNVHVVTHLFVMLIIALLNVLNFTLRNVIITAGTSTFAFTKDTFKENKQIK